MTRQSTGNSFYYGMNSLGSVTVLSDSVGAKVESYEYRPFGETTIKNASGTDITASSNDAGGYSNPFRFTARRKDFEEGSDFYHYRTRQYSPKTGRFIGHDKIPGKDWGDELNVGNGLAYVGNNPTNFTDPFGLQSKGGKKNVKTGLTPEQVRKKLDELNKEIAKLNKQKRPKDKKAASEALKRKQDLIKERDALRAEDKVNRRNPRKNPGTDGKSTKGKANSKTTSQGNKPKPGCPSKPGPSKPSSPGPAKPGGTKPPTPPMGGGPKPKPPTGGVKGFLKKLGKSRVGGVVLPGLGWGLDIYDFFSKEKPSCKCTPISPLMKEPHGPNECPYEPDYIPPKISKRTNRGRDEGEHACSINEKFGN